MSQSPNGRFSGAGPNAGRIAVSPMSCERFLERLLPVCLAALCGCASGLTHAEIPSPGVPSEELAFLRHRYDLDETRCTHTPEEVIEMQTNGSATRWSDCVYAATMYWRGCGVAQDLARAKTFYGRGCSYGSMMGCAMAGSITDDPDRSLALLEEPCKRGYPEACGNIGVVLLNRGRPADASRASQLLESTCRQNRQFCSGFGEIVMNCRLTAKYSAARELLEAACKDKDYASCHVLARSYEDGTLSETDYARAMALNESNCEIGYLPGCNALGHMFVNGHGCPKDELRGAGLFYGACGRDYGPACDSMGEATEKGWGGPADPIKALPFYDRGCELGDEHACNRAKELRAAK
jgi:TPR repeat protein